MIKDKTPTALAGLENLLVKQFRTLQDLVVVTKKEREILPKNDMEALMCVVEEKEALLDQLGLLDDARRKTIHDLELELGIQKADSTLEDILEHLDRSQATRITRLRDGVSTLVAQARDLNYGNQALATSMVEWIHAAQKFMIDLAQPDNVGYRPPAQVPAYQSGSSWGVEHRA